MPTCLDTKRRLDRTERQCLLYMPVSLPKNYVLNPIGFDLYEVLPGKKHAALSPLRYLESRQMRRHPKLLTRQAISSGWKDWQAVHQYTVHHCM